MTDGRFSGATHGLMAGHVAPEAAVGGPIAALREGDTIVFDVDKRGLDVEISDEEMQRRLASWTPPAPHYTTGVFAKYAKLVSSASEGASRADAGNRAKRHRAKAETHCEPERASARRGNLGTGVEEPAPAA